MKQITSSNRWAWAGSFDNPTPTRLIREMLRLSTSSSDVVLDFVAGSGTTADAVMQLNAEDGGNRYNKITLGEIERTVIK